MIIVGTRYDMSRMPLYCADCILHGKLLYGSQAEILQDAFFYITKDSI